MKYVLLIGAVLIGGCAGSGEVIGSPFQGNWDGDAMPVLSPDHTAWHMTANISSEGFGTVTYQEQNHSITVDSDGTVTGAITGKFTRSGDRIDLDIHLRGMNLQGSLSRAPR